MPKNAIFGYFCIISQKIEKNPKFYSLRFFVSTQRSHKKIFSFEAQTVWPEFFLKPKLWKSDLFFDPWPLTFWPMTSPFWDLLAITKTHIGYKFHQDPPMGTWWKVVDCLTAWLTHSLTHITTSMGERCHPKIITSLNYEMIFSIWF